jgi:hypothetical protein
MCWLKQQSSSGGGVSISEGVESKRPESMIGQGKNEPPNQSTGPVGGRHKEMTTHPRGPSRHDSVEERAAQYMSNNKLMFFSEFRLKPGLGLGGES